MKNNSKDKSNQLFSIEGYQICLICDADEKKPELGTGFLFLRTDWIVTAKHVVMDDGLIRGNLYAEFPTNNPNKVGLRVIAVHPESDIALLEITSIPNPCRKPLFPGYDDLSVSKGLVCCGYTPTNGKTISISLAKVYDKSTRERKTTETVLEFESKGIEGGSSGGPIFGDGGVVLGLLINVFTPEEQPDRQFARATSIHNLMDAIEIEFNENKLQKIDLVEDLAQKTVRRQKPIRLGLFGGKKLKK